MSSEKRKSTFNLRPCFFCFLALSGGVLFSYASSFYGLPAPCCLLVFLAPFLLPLFSRKKAYAVLLSLFCIAFFFLGMLLFSGATRFLNETIAGYGSFSGRVAEKTLCETGYRYVLSSLARDGESLPARALLFSSDNYAIGDILSFSGDLSLAALRADGSLHTYYLSENIRYLFSDVTGLERAGVSFSLTAYLRESLFDLLFTFLPYDEASVCLALVTGDSSMMEENLLSSLRLGGVAHLVAVSGLHMGIVYGGVTTLLRRLQCPRVLNSIVAFALGLFYAAISGFSASALRAFLMCAIADLAFYAKGQGDLLERISLSGILLLVHRPFYLLSYGFILSFAAVFGIGFLFHPFSSFFQRARLREEIAQMLAISLSVNLTLFPLLIDMFGYVSLIGLFLNLVVVPVVSLCFAAILILLLFAVAFPFAAPAFLFLPGLFLKGFCFTFTYFDFSPFVLSGFSFGAAMIPYYTGLLLSSDKLNIGRFRPYLVAACFVGALVSVLF